MPTPITSGSFSSQYSASQIVTEAFKLCAVQPAEQPLQSFEMQDGLIKLDILARRWQKDNIHLWTQVRAIVFLQKGQAQYSLGPGSGDHACTQDNFRYTTLLADEAATETTLSVTSSLGFSANDYIGVELDDGTRWWSTIISVPDSTSVTIASGIPSSASAGGSVFVYTTKIQRPLRITSIRRSIFNQDSEIPLEIWAQEQYDDQVNKRTQGTPVNAYYSPVQGENTYVPPDGSGILYVWQAPDMSNYYLNITFLRPIQDILIGGNALDFPVEWTQAIIYNLAADLAISYSVPLEKIQILQQLAAFYYDECLGWDEELPASLNIRPNRRGRA